MQSTSCNIGFGITVENVMLSFFTVIGDVNILIFSLEMLLGDSCKNDINDIVYIGKKLARFLLSLMYDSFTFTSSHAPLRVANFQARHVDNTN